WRIMQPLETTTCPFRARPRTNERPHWIEPKLVAEIAFTEVTADGKLRAPAYIGLRDDALVTVAAESTQTSRSSPARAKRAAFDAPGKTRLSGLIDQLDDRESRRDGVLTLPGWLTPQ